MRDQVVILCGYMQPPLLPEVRGGRTENTFAEVRRSCFQHYGETDARRTSEGKGERISFGCLDLS